MQLVWKVRSKNYICLSFVVHKYKLADNWNTQKYKYLKTHLSYVASLFEIKFIQPTLKTA